MSENGFYSLYTCDQSERGHKRTKLMAQRDTTNKARVIPDWRGGTPNSPGSQLGWLGESTGPYYQEILYWKMQANNSVTYYFIKKQIFYWKFKTC